MPWTLILGAIPLAAAAWTDGRSRRIPDCFPLAVLACALANVVMGDVSILRVLAGVVLVGLPLLLCAVLLEGGAAIGGGDVKLCAAVGGLIGAVPALLAVAATLCVMLLCAAAAHKPALPFAPFFFPVYGLILMMEMMKC